MSAPNPPVAALAVISAVEGVGLLGYAVYDVVEALRVGVSGPEEVSNVPAVVLLIAIQAIFGAGLLWIAYGWWRSRRWARSPFLVAQLLGGLVGYELAQSTGGVERITGISVIAIAVVGIVLAFLPATSRALEAD